MDSNNFPIWEDGITGWRAELWRSHFSRQEVYDAYNSWYLRAGIPKSQEVYFEAYDLSFREKLKAIFKSFTAKARPRDEVFQERRNQQVIPIVKKLPIIHEGPKEVKYSHVNKEFSKGRGKQTLQHGFKKDEAKSVRLEPSISLSPQKKEPGKRGIGTTGNRKKSGKVSTI